MMGQVHRLEVLSIISVGLSVLQFLSECCMLCVRSSLLDLWYCGFYSFLSQPLLSCYKGSSDFQHYPGAWENPVPFLFSCPLRFNPHLKKLLPCVAPVQEEFLTGHLHLELGHFLYTWRGGRPQWAGESGWELSGALSKGIQLKWLREKRL